MKITTMLNAAACVAALAVIAAACGSAEAAQRKPGSASDPRAVTLVTYDLAFEAPSRVPAGRVTVELRNRGSSLHHVSLARLPAGTTLDEVYAAVRQGGPLPEWMREVGAPHTPNPGMSSSLTLDLEPGTYALLAWANIPEDVPHVMRGMARILTVTPAAVPMADRAPRGPNGAS